MEKFIEEVEAYATAAGIEPTTVIYKAASIGHRMWQKWLDGSSSPTLRNVDRIRKFMADNPPDQEVGA